MYTDPNWQRSWAEGSVGEVVRIIAVSGNTLTLERPLHFDYSDALNPKIRSQGFIEHVGLERLRIHRLDSGDGDTVIFRNAAWVWLLGVESDTTVRSHLQANTVYGCEVRNSWFHHSHDYGSGGHGYGIELSRHATACLIEDNVFDNLRHSMLVQVGANGNVFGYNYSTDSRSENHGPLPDISVHGHYPAYNLFEGNVVEEAHISDYWGPAGPGNTLLRNCLEGDDLSVSDHSHKQNLLGNDLVASSGNEIDIDETVTQTLAHGNHVAGQTRWAPGVDQDIPGSLYLQGRPSFWNNDPWPVSLQSRPALCDLPAKRRFAAGEPIGVLFADSFESGGASSWQ